RPRGHVPGQGVEPVEVGFPFPSSLLLPLPLGPLLLLLEGDHVGQRAPADVRLDHPPAHLARLVVEPARAPPFPPHWLCNPLCEPPLPSSGRQDTTPGRGRASSTRGVVSASLGE